MIQVDMHVHSAHSRHPSEWFLQRIGARESYTPVEEVYRLAKARGMTYVTLTDHNTIDGALELNARHPGDTFVSAEVTSYFPENGCKVHILVFGITSAQFARIQEARPDVYALRNYLRDERIACSVAHATYSVNGRLTVDIAEKLVLLFDVFEGINGGRHAVHNRTWAGALRALTPARLEGLRLKHGIEPWSEDSWFKGLTAGSDDHAGLLVGQTYTLACDATIPEFLDLLRRRETQPAGRHADHRSLACSVYKIAHAFTRAERQDGPASPLSLLHDLVFNDPKPGVRNWLAIRKLRSGGHPGGDVFARCVSDLLDAPPGDPLDSGARIDRMYEALATLSDGFFTLIAESIEQDLQKGDPRRLVGTLSAALPAFFLLAPFITVLRHMHEDRPLLREIGRAFGSEREEPRRLMWFSDTILELNGVAVTLRELARSADTSGRPLKLVTCLADNENKDGLPPNVVLLPCLYSVTPAFYSAWTLRLPSLLRAFDRIATEAPDEIVISTPGPVGLAGLLAARLLRIPCTGIYHTDFTRQADQFIGDTWVSSIIETYTRGFFSLVDTLRVPSAHYRNILAERGFDTARMKPFPRGIEPGFAVVDAERRAAWRRRLELAPEAPVLLWAGRLGREKNLDFLLDVFRAVAALRPDVRLVLAGNGPELERLQAACADEPAIAFTGRLEREELPHLYGLADAFLFPSTTDTFGMAVLEAQACGLPALVSDVGGPQELVVTGETGFVIKADDIPAWTQAVIGLLDLKREEPALFARMRAAARKRAQNGFGWDALLTEMMGPDSIPAAPAAPAGSTPAPERPLQSAPRKPGSAKRSANGPLIAP